MTKIKKKVFTPSNKKTTEDFKREVFNLVDNEYEVLGEYESTHAKIELRHNSKQCDNNTFPVSRTRFLGGNRCPVCSHISRVKKNKKNHPNTEKFKLEVENLKGKEYSVIGEYEHTHKPIEMKHNSKQCNNHTFPISRTNFIAGKGCPVCFKINATKTHETFLKEVKELGNDEYEVLGHYINSDEHVTFKHKTCSREFPMRPRCFLSGGNRCPHCMRERTQSIFEEFIEKYLQSLDVDYDKEVCFEECYNKSDLFFDFYIETESNYILIEYDGKQHTHLWHSTENPKRLERQKENDKIKNAFCKKYNIPLLRLNWKHKEEDIENLLMEFLVNHNIINNALHASNSVSKLL